MNVFLCVKLSPVSQQQLIKRLRKLGWKGPVAGGKHPHMVKNDIQLTIPTRMGAGISELVF